MAIALLSSARQAMAAPIKVACVGDSITAGTTGAANAYPAVLGVLAGTGWDVRNFGNSGKTMIKAPSDGASYWVQTQFTQSQSFAPDIVTIMLGTNDSKTVNWNNGNNTYAADYKAMIAIYQALPSRPVIYALLPPPAISSSFTISGSVIQNQIIPIIRMVAAQTGVGIIDVHGAFNANQPSTLFGTDGIHPNNPGYTLIADTIWATIKQLGGDGGASAAPEAGAFDGGVGVDSPVGAPMDASATGTAGDASVREAAAGGGSVTVVDASPPGNGDASQATTSSPPGPTGSAGAQDAEGGGGSASAALDDGSATAADAGASAVNASAKGCGCRAVGRDSRPSDAGLVLATALAVAAARRRRRSS